jgi:hypothetical protein
VWVGGGGGKEAWAYGALLCECNVSCRLMILHSIDVFLQ